MKSEDIILILEDTAKYLNYKCTVRENMVDFLDENGKIVIYAYVSELDNMILDNIILLYDYICEFEDEGEKLFTILNALNMNDEIFRFVIQENGVKEEERNIMLLMEFQIYPISESHIIRQIKEKLPKFIERRNFYKQCIKDACLSVENNNKK